jgi:hypothetical protein
MKRGTHSDARGTRVGRVSEAGEVWKTGWAWETGTASASGTSHGATSHGGKGTTDGTGRGCWIEPRATPCLARVRVVSNPATTTAVAQ